MNPAEIRATPKETRTDSAPSEPVLLRRPEIADGAEIWQLAKDSQVLDVNSSYSYLLWCRDFHATSIIAESNGSLVGFITGFARPQSPDTLFVWQVAVDASQRGKGVGVAMLNRLLDNLAPQGITRLETTVSPDNPASIAMFTRLARRREVPITKKSLFDAGDFPGAHEAEDLYIVGPVSEPEGPEKHEHP